MSYTGDRARGNGEELTSSVKDGDKGTDVLLPVGHLLEPKNVPVTPGCILLSITILLLCKKKRDKAAFTWLCLFSVSCSHGEKGGPNYIVIASLCLHCKSLYCHHALLFTLNNL